MTRVTRQTRWSRPRCRRLTEGELLDLLKLWPEQHFTQPPPRYTEATLVKVLEEQGIGRPSTYAPILSTIQDRGYVLKEEKKFTPTELGIAVNDLLVEHFPDIVDVGFTSTMEGELDDVASGERALGAGDRRFLRPLRERADRRPRSSVGRIEVSRPEPQKTGELCPESGHELVIRESRFGPFIACSGFPKCRYTRPIVVSMGVECPQCGQGQIIEKKSKKGRVFYSCSRYPDCDFSLWEKPDTHALPPLRRPHDRHGPHPAPGRRTEGEVYQVRPDRRLGRKCARREGVRGQRGVIVKEAK